MREVPFPPLIVTKPVVLLFNEVVYINLEISIGSLLFVSPKAINSVAISAKVIFFMHDSFILIAEMFACVEKGELI